MNKAIKCDAPCRLQICGHFVIPKRVFAINNGHVGKITKILELLYEIDFNVPSI